MTEENIAGNGGGAEPRLDQLTPKEIVAELDKYIIGQQHAKRALAVAIRDRVRRLQLPQEIADDIQPRNVILIGPTGVGKTELARRLARLSSSPFIKVEASKFTEVGYVGRDVESIIRDLVEIAVEMVRHEKTSQIEKKAEENAEERLIDLLAGSTGRPGKRKSGGKTRRQSANRQSRDQIRRDLRDGKLNQREVEVEIQERMFPPPDFYTSMAEEELDLPMRELMSGWPGGRPTRKKMKVEDAIDYFISEEESKLVDLDQVARDAVDRVESSGIVFLDEIDKIAGRESRHGPDVSREGVQRDILPIVEGTVVNTRFGMVETDRILFIAAGAFHVTKPSDLIPELQGRFPVRVEMSSLTEEDFREILTKPRTALVKQYTALLGTEGLELEFTPDAIHEIARMAWLVNETMENIGARRLHTIMEALLEELSFEGADVVEKEVRIDRSYVQRKLEGTVKDLDLSRYIL